MGEGGPILRDINENHLLSCSDNRTVYRIDVATGKADLLASGLSFDDAAVVYEKNTLWLCRGTERLLSTYPYPPLVLMALPLQGKHEVQRHEREMQCKKFSVTNDGNYVWIASDEDYKCCVRILSVHEGLKVVQQFESDEGERVGHIDANVGLVLTQKEYFPDGYFVIKCWKL